MIRLVFLGKLVEIVGSPEIDVEDGTLEEILSRLPLQLGNLLKCEKICFALNGTLVSDHKTVLTDGDELAFLPPVSGG